MNKAQQLLALTEHRGKPGTPRKPSPYVSDPYDISPSEYRQAKRRIKQEYKERGRATQKKLNREIVDRLQRKVNKFFSNRAKRKAEIEDLTAKYRRAQIDREHGSTPGDWRAKEGSKYPDARRRRGRPPGSRNRNPDTRPRELPSPDEYADDAILVDPEDYYYQEPETEPEYLPEPSPQRGSSRPRRDAIDRPRAPGGELPPAKPRRSKPKGVGPGKKKDSGRSLPPGRRGGGRKQLPPGKAAKKVRKRN